MKSVRVRVPDKLIEAFEIHARASKCRMEEVIDEAMQYYVAHTIRRRGIASKDKKRNRKG